MLRQLAGEWGELVESEIMNMLFVQTDFRKGLLFQNPVDAMAFAAAVNNAIHVEQKGYSGAESQQFIKLEEPLMNLIAVTPVTFIERPKVEEDTRPSAATPKEEPAF